MRSGRSLALAALAGLLAVAVVVVLLARDEGGGTPSFGREVAPILAEKCAGCHQPGGIAPFSLDSAATASARAAAIAAAVEARRMPPWPPGPESPEYVGQDGRALSDGERAAIVEWARSGGRVDGAALQPPAPETPVVSSGWVADIGMQRSYRPQGGTDDYRCFLLDPHLDGWAFVTGADIRPGSPSMVHHVILFRASPGQVSEAKQLDRRSSVAGWPCFGGTGLGAGIDALDDAGWLAAWAPGGDPVRYPDGTGAELQAGSGVVMQVHYNLLNGVEVDRTSVALNLVSGSEDLEPASTMLLPGPVELPCAPGARGPLCSREAAIADLVRKRGASAALLPAGLQVLCGGSPFGTPAAGPVSSCSRGFDRRTTIHGVAGHMHLLGRSIRVELLPADGDARVLLDIPRWDFHWQNAYTFVEPVVAEPGDRVRVTCRHDASLGEGEPRYVVWGEGTTDEMCLGVLQVTRG
jgi:mono/diheme cytochrome c family protein